MPRVEDSRGGRAPGGGVTPGQAPASASVEPAGPTPAAYRTEPAPPRVHPAPAVRCAGGDAGFAGESALAGADLG